jgi:hypothetical protein
LKPSGDSGTARVRLQGTSVCSGTAMGRACVVTSLEQIGELKRGDVLITHSTDVGWSPYFPLLEGVVTELGGIISHGEHGSYFTVSLFSCLSLVHHHHHLYFHKSSTVQDVEKSIQIQNKQYKVRSQYSYIGK